MSLRLWRKKPGGVGLLVVKCREAPHRVVWGLDLLCVVRRCPTLPHPLECSTIGAVGLSFRVRNGTGRFPHAMTTVTHSPVPTRSVWCGWFVGCSCDEQQYFIIHDIHGPCRPGCTGCGGVLFFVSLGRTNGWVCWLGTT